MSPASGVSALPGAGSGFAAKVWRAAEAVWAYLRQGGGVTLAGRRTRRMRVAETLSLGEKRFVTILEVDGQTLLLGSSGVGVSLLTTLPVRSGAGEPTFAQVMQSSQGFEPRAEKVQ